MPGGNVTRALRPLVLFLVACGGKDAPDAATKPDAAVDAIAADANVDDAASSAPATWVQLVREERWAPAAAAIDALPDADRNKPEVRYARAAVAFARGDGKTAVSSLESLEGGLPALAPEIARLRARAQVIAGPFVDAGEWLEKHAASNDDHLAAANAFMKAKLPTRATAQCARIISSDH
ncbi:MAG TPA: hypothetical protein VGH87_30820, partial [Polyangiaceae bacterium]